MEVDKKNKIEELVKRYGIDLEKLKKEQIELAKQLEIKDKIDFSLADRFGAIDNTFIGNKILCCIIVCNKDYEIIDRAYSFEKIRFPYIPGFRNYRELIPMIKSFEKLNEKPDVIFVPGQGIIHPRLSLASHFSLSTGVPSIGISNSLNDINLENEKDGDDIFRNKKKIGRVLIGKLGSRPMYISPGNLISVDIAYEISKKLINLPHKRPEPSHLAGRYAKQVKKELV